jgi:hypothetical protein
MKKNQIDESSQNSDSMTNQPKPEKNKEPQKEKPGVIDPDSNDPTRNDKPPLIISKL